MNSYSITIQGVRWHGKAESIGHAVRKAAYIIGVDLTLRGASFSYRKN